MSIWPNTPFLVLQYIWPRVVLLTVPFNSPGELGAPFFFFYISVVVIPPVVIGNIYCSAVSVIACPKAANFAESFS